jgi:hypothetical protein
VEGIFDLHYASLPVARLVEALRYKPEGRGSIPDGVIASCREIWEPQPSGTLWAFNRPLQALLYLLYQIQHLFEVHT